MHDKCFIQKIKIDNHTEINAFTTLRLRYLKIYQSGWKLNLPIFYSIQANPESQYLSPGLG